MEKILFPLKYMKVTQGMNGAYSHKGTYAIDYGYGGDENVYAPFTGTIKKIYTGSGANSIWLLSNSKVEFADGSKDYAIMKCAHDNNISDLSIGKVIKQGQHFYNMGTAGQVTGKHVHIEIAKGSKVGWYQNSAGNWMITGSIDQTKAFFVPSDVKIVKDGGYAWKALIEQIGAPVKRDTTKNQVEVKIDNLRARKAPNGEKMGYINKGIYNVISEKKDGDYLWYQVETNTWIAFDSSWATYYPLVKEEPTDNPQEEPTLPNEQPQENENRPKFSIQIDKDGLYAINLHKGETLEIY